jgi:hypothetical protein
MPVIIQPSRSSVAGRSRHSVNGKRVAGVFRQGVL